MSHELQGICTNEIVGIRVIVANSRCDLNVMVIDIIIIVFLVIAVIKGLQRGFIVAIFSIIAIIIGLAAAMKLSTVVATYLDDSVNVSARWLPIISFVLVFVGVVMLVRLGANLLQKTVEIAFLGWLNRLGGAFVYVLLYMVVLSVLLFYAEQLGLIKRETMAESKLYSTIHPVGPYVINGLGEFIPFFKDMFAKLKSFLSQLSEEVVNRHIKTQTEYFITQTSRYFCIERQLI